MQRSDIVIRGRTEHTKRRHLVGLLLKRAMRGNRQAKLRLYKEFGIRVYSSEEVNDYVRDRLSQEYTSGQKSVSNGPTVITRKKQLKDLPKSSALPQLRRNRGKGSLSRARIGLRKN